MPYSLRHGNEGSEGSGDGRGLLPGAGLRGRDRGRERLASGSGVRPGGTRRDGPTGRGGIAVTNRVEVAASKLRAALESGEKLDGSGPMDPEAVAGLDEVSRIDFSEHAAYQDAQARAH